MNVFTRTWSTLGGRLLARSGRVGILATTGRRTGARRSTPVGFVLRPDGSVLIGAGGDSRAWPRNLLANPSCAYSIRGVERRYRARLLEGEARDDAIAAFGAKMGRRAEGAAWAEVFALEPID